jgi:hypothetical protein
LVGLLGFLTIASASTASAASDNEILLARPLVPRDIDLFSTRSYSEAAPMAPASGAEPSAQQVSQMLNVYLKAEFPGDTASQNAAKAIFNSSIAKAKIQSASLRAALASLKGTLAAPAINYVLNAKTPGGHPKVTTVKWVPPGQTPDPTRAIAAVYGAGTGDFDQTEIRFNNRYQAENPFLFMPVMAHEVLHQDLSVANYEESVIGTLNTLLQIQQRARHPRLALLGTELPRRINTGTTQRLNSGRGSKLGLFETNANRLILPGGDVPPLTRSWWEEADNGDRTTTPGNSLLGKYLANIHTPGAPNCSSATFNKALLDCIDKQGNAGLTASELVKAAKAMKLNTNIERRRALSIAYGHSDFTGRLSSSQKPCTRSQSVAVYRQKSGADPKVGTDRTNSSGAYSVHKSGAKGTFYAKAPRSTVAGTGVCLAAKSSNKRVG